jgi:hypothetical protein
MKLTIATRADRMWLTLVLALSMGVTPLSQGDLVAPTRIGVPGYATVKLEKGGRDFVVTGVSPAVLKFADTVRSAEIKVDYRTRIPGVPVQIVATLWRDSTPLNSDIFTKTWREGTVVETHIINIFRSLSVAQGANRVTIRAESFAVGTDIHAVPLPSKDRATAGAVSVYTATVALTTPERKAIGHNLPSQISLIPSNVKPPFILRRVTPTNLHLVRPAGRATMRVTLETLQASVPIEMAIGVVRKGARTDYRGSNCDRTYTGIGTHTCDLSIDAALAAQSDAPLFLWVRMPAVGPGYVARIPVVVDTRQVVRGAAASPPASAPPQPAPRPLPPINEKHMLVKPKTP